VLDNSSPEKGVLSMRHTDEQIKKEVVRRISSNSRVDARNIGVHVRDGRVELRGAVGSHSARDLAAREALAADEVSALDNQLKVETAAEAGSAETAPNDGELKSQIDSALSKFFSTKEARLQVTVDDGVVTVEGTVETLWLKVQVERIASEPSGVIRVKNRVEVVPVETRPDEAIAKAILEALGWSDLTDERKVDVHVERGIVTLQGTVSSGSEAQVILNAALNTVGVRDIRNDLETRTLEDGMSDRAGRNVIPS
jgi:osmotically-inducible protein OsmY